MTIDVYNNKKEKTETLEVPMSFLGVRWNPNTVAQVVDVYFANQRQTLAHTKGRGEVRGGGKKPWKQKHTGQARHGSRRSPIWVGGGITFGPIKEKDYTKKINKKMKKVALLSVLSKKHTDNELYVINEINLKEQKTKQLAALLNVFFKDTKKVALIPSKDHYNDLIKTGKNINRLTILNAESLHAHDFMRPKYALIEKNAFETMMSHYKPA